MCQTAFHTPGHEPTERRSSQTHLGEKRRTQSAPCMGNDV